MICFLFLVFTFVEAQGRDKKPQATYVLISRRNPNHPRCIHITPTPQSHMVWQGARSRDNKIEAGQYRQHVSLLSYQVSHNHQGPNRFQTSPRFPPLPSPDLRIIITATTIIIAIIITLQNPTKPNPRSPPITCQSHGKK